MADEYIIQNATEKEETAVDIREFVYNTDLKRSLPVSVSSVPYSKDVMIGHARIDESGKTSGGTAGDTNEEVVTRIWYSHPWHTVFRAKSTDKALKIASAMSSACKNNKIGYDQNQRLTLFNEVKDKNYDPSKATNACETDCSALVRVCCYYAGIKPSDFVTSTEESKLMATGAFTKYTSSDYISGSSKLQVGDILLGNGHTAVVVSAPSGSTGTIPAQYGTFATREFSFDGLANFSWASGTTQKKIINYWKNTKNKSTVKTYFAGIDNCIFIACTTKYGKIGDHITWFFNDGSSIDTIMADSKNTHDSGANEWGHNGGKCVLEFCGIKSSIPKGYNSPMVYFNVSHVDSWTNHGQYRTW